MNVALWLAGLAAAVALALAANVVLLRTDGSNGDPAGRLSPKLVRPVVTPTTGPAPTTTEPNDHGRGRDHVEDD